MSLLFQDAEGFPFNIQMTDNGDGTSFCVYVPSKAIKHTIIVTWANVNVPNSPFRVEAHGSGAGVSGAHRPDSVCGSVGDDWRGQPSREGQSLRSRGGEDGPESQRANILHSGLQRGRTGCDPVQTRLFLQRWVLMLTRFDLQQVMLASG